MHTNQIEVVFIWLLCEPVKEDFLWCFNNAKLSQCPERRKQRSFSLKDFIIVLRYCHATHRHSGSEMKQLVVTKV